MSKQAFIQQTKEFLIEQYRYNENLLEIDAIVPASDGGVILDILIIDQDRKPIGGILTSSKPRSRKDFLLDLKEILTKTSLTYCIYRYENQDDIPGFIGLVKEESLFTDEIIFKELVDYPRPDVSWPEFIFNLLPYLDG